MYRRSFFSIAGYKTGTEDVSKIRRALLRIGIKYRLWTVNFIPTLTNKPIRPYLGEIPPWFRSRYVTGDGTIKAGSEERKICAKRTNRRRRMFAKIHKRAAPSFCISIAVYVAFITVFDPGLRAKRQIRGEAFLFRVERKWMLMTATRRNFF